MRPADSLSPAQGVEWSGERGLAASDVASKGVRLLLDHRPLVVPTDTKVSIDTIVQ